MPFFLRLAATAFCTVLGMAVWTVADAGEGKPPKFHYRLERELNYEFRSLKRQKAYAIGAENYGYFSYGYNSLAEAKRQALKGCKAYVREKLGKSADPQCRIIMENDKLVWTGPKPEPLTKSYLKQPDRPLMQAAIVGNLSEAKRILLFLHGCDGQGGPNNYWYMGWTKFFTDRGYAVIEPNSFADDHMQVCSYGAPPSFFDYTYRLRVAQTLRTLETLKKRFPSVPIVLWGHSEGGNIVQLIDYKVDGVIITGATCLMPQPKLKVPMLHIFGGKDSFSMVDDEAETLTEKKIRKACRNYASKGKKRFVLVPDGDHLISVWRPEVSAAIEAILPK